MSSTPARTPERRSHLLRTLALSLAAFAIVGVANISPANAWYDAYGYWHPSHHYYYHHAYWHHRWCEYHPYSCGYGHHDYGYYGGYSGY